MKKNQEVSPEVVAVISAAIQALTGQKGLAFRVRRVSNAWSMAARGGRR